VLVASGVLALGGMLVFTAAAHTRRRNPAA
jgi:hypothetical protein